MVLLSSLDDGAKLWAAEHPLVIYTNLEPCLMCLGAAMQVGVDEIGYGMKAAPDGGAQFVDAIREGGQTPPKITAGVLEDECVALMSRLLEVHPEHLAIDYVRAMLAVYE